jgi:type II secretory pathway pseudopilin PulG
VKQQRRYIAASQRGFGAVEMLIVLAISMLAITAGASFYMRHLDRQSNLVAGEHMNLVAEAATTYIKDNYAAVLAVATPAAPAVITIDMLRATGHLPDGFSDENAYGQGYSVLALEPRPDELETLIVTHNGEAIRDIYLIEIAKQMGAKGGYIASTNTATAMGSFGGWSMSLGPYGVAPGAGHLASALFFEHGAQVNDYLYRSAVPGQAQLNKMNTSIDMGGNSLNNADAVNAATVNVSGDTITAGETYTGGWFRSKGDSGWYNEKWNGGWFMNDPDWVRSYSDKSVYTGGMIVGGSVQSLGRAVFGEYLQVAGLATVGSGCTPNGLIGRDTAGKTLSCQDGVWRAGSFSASLPVVLVQYSDSQSHSHCQAVSSSALITGTGPGSIALSVDGVVVGSAIGYSGEYIDVAIDTSVTALVPAGRSFCFTSSVKIPGYAQTSGMRVVASYLE